MTTPQQPIDSGFDRDSTVDDVLDGIDLTGRLAIVTGGYSGIGIENVRAPERSGARPSIVPARRPDVAREAAAGPAPTSRSPSSISPTWTPCAPSRTAFLDSERAIDVLINSAGVMGPPETRVAHGWELQFAANHLGHFALTNRLWPALVADGGARVIAVSSRGHKFGPIRWDDLAFQRRLRRLRGPTASPSGPTCCSRCSSTRSAQATVCAPSPCIPGGIYTNLQRLHDPCAAGGARLVRRRRKPDHALQDPGAGRRDLVVGGERSPQLDREWAASTARTARSPRAVEPGSDPLHGVEADAIDPGDAARLKSVSAGLTGVDAFAAV